MKVAEGDPDLSKWMMQRAKSVAYCLDREPVIVTISKENGGFLAFQTPKIPFFQSPTSYGGSLLISRNLATELTPGELDFLLAYLIYVAQDSQFEGIEVSMVAVGLLLVAGIAWWQISSNLWISFAVYGVLIALAFAAIWFCSFRHFVKQNQEIFDRAVAFAGRPAAEALVANPLLRRRWSKSFARNLRQANGTAPQTPIVG